MNYLAPTFKSAPVLIVLSVVCILFAFNASGVYFIQFNRVFNVREVLPFSFLVTYSFIFLFLLPFGVSKYLSKESLRDLGLLLPEDKKKTRLLIIAALLLLIPAIIYSAQFKSVQMVYSLKEKSFYFLLFMLVAMPPYYFAEEFFFRGFLFLGLWRRIGWHSYWVTELLYMWAHLGKPPIEILISFPAGMVLNYLTLQTRSIYPAILAHFIVGVLLSTLVTYFF